MRVKRQYSETFFDYEHRNDIQYEGRRYYPTFYPNNNKDWLAAWWGRTASHNHTCELCGNVRNHRGIRTRKEYLADRSAEEECLELGIHYKRYNDKNGNGYWN
jgi:hypothetical protein